MEQQIVYVKDVLSPVMNFLENCGYDKHTLWGNMYNDFSSMIRFYDKLGFERENTHQRQMEGIKEAKKKGIKFGRPKRDLPDKFYEIATIWREGEISLREGARILKISHSTFSRKLKENGFIKPTKNK